MQMDAFANFFFSFSLKGSIKGEDDIETHQNLSLHEIQQNSEKEIWCLLIFFFFLGKKKVEATFPNHRPK